eukprot:1136874-Pelagomonas_calceolata.AAC.1
MGNPAWVSCRSSYSTYMPGIAVQSLPAISQPASSSKLKPGRPSFGSSAGTWFTAKKENDSWLKSPRQDNIFLSLIFPYR